MKSQSFLGSISIFSRCDFRKRVFYCENFWLQSEMNWNMKNQENNFLLKQKSEIFFPHWEKIEGVIVFLETFFSLWGTRKKIFQISAQFSKDFLELKFQKSLFKKNCSSNLLFTVCIPFFKKNSLTNNFLYLKFELSLGNNSFEFFVFFCHITRPMENFCLKQPGVLLENYSFFSI